MEALRLPVSVRRLAGLLLLACGPVGCQSSLAWRKMADDGPPRSGEASQVVATWSNKVHFVPDVMHGGTPMPGIVGRVYLFGPQVDFPHTGDGKFVAELFDDSGPTPGGLAIEQWNIDKETAKKLVAKDLIGWGYTVFLPWGTYRPDTTKVHVAVRFEPEKGQALYASGSPLTLEHAPPTPAGAVQQAGAKVAQPK